jgi:hypothetical protein
MVRLSFLRHEVSTITKEGERGRKGEKRRLHLSCLRAHICGIAALDTGTPFRESERRRVRDVRHIKCDSRTVEKARERLSSRVSEKTGTSREAEHTK